MPEADVNDRVWHFRNQNRVEDYFFASRRAITPPGGHTVPKEQGTKRFVPALAAASTGYF